MRKSLLIAAVATLGVAGAAAADDFSQVDRDKNGLVSFQEMKNAEPNVTEDEFSSYDGNADGSLNENEFAIWEAATENKSGSQPQPRSMSPGGGAGGLDRPHSQPQTPPPSPPR